MKLRLIAVGKDRKGLFSEPAAEYASRIRRYLPFEVLEVPASKRSDPTVARREEAARILTAVADRSRLVALEVEGAQLSSEKLAGLISDFALQSRDVDFVIGGDEGLDSSIRDRAERLVSLGPMTLPHQLARLVLLEQLYRAMTIIRGEPYHK